MIVQHLRKAVLRTDTCDRGPEISPAIIKFVMTSNHSKMSSHSTAGETKHVPFTIPQKLEIIRRPESDKSRSVVQAAYKIGFSTVYDMKTQRDQLLSFVASH
jgi:hypothetical protein